MTDERLGPTSALSAPKRTNAVAVQKTARTTIATTASLGTVSEGVLVSAKGASTSAAIVSAPNMIARGSTLPRPSLRTIGPPAYPHAAIRIATAPSSSSWSPATSRPTSAMTPPKPTNRPASRLPVGRSEGSNRSVRTATISGTAAIRMAASDDDTCCSPKPISGNGIAISATA